MKMTTFYKDVARRGLVALGLLFAALSTAHAGLLYSIRETDNTLVSIDTNTLAYTVIGATGVSGDFGGLGYNANTDTLFWIPGRRNNALYTINRATGAATLVGIHGISDLFGLEYDPSTNTLFASQFSGGTGLYSLNMSTGAAATINAAMSNDIGGLAYDSLRDRLVGIADGAGDLYAINRATGAQALLFDGDFVNDSGLAFDPQLDRFWDIDWNGVLSYYNVGAGFARTTVLSGLDAHDGLAYVGAAVVPEPTTLALLGLGLAGLAATRRRKQ